jgi:DnaJ-domain-containing protein 1
MITKMLIEIFQAITEDPFVRKMLGMVDLNKKSDNELEDLMNELGLDGEQRKKFQEAYQDYQKDPYGSYQKYKYKYEPKSNNPFDKFDAYYQKFEDKAKEHEEKYGKGTGDYRHREYAKYRQQYGNNTNNNSQKETHKKQTSTTSSEDKKHYDVLELKQGATFEEIKTAYKQAMKKYHPDRFSDEDQKKYAESLSRKINGAYDYFKKKFDKS